MKRSILITGATGKLGKVFVKFFLENGDQVIALSKNKNNLNKLKADFFEYEDSLKIISLDLMKKDFEKELILKFRNQNIKPNCLVNNARSMENLKLNKDGSSSEEALLAEYKLGVIAPYKLVLSLLKMNNKKLKKVVNISSIYGLVAPNKNLYESKEILSPIHYGLSKAALIQLTKDLAVRYSINNIEVNCIAYGGVKGRVDKNFEDRYSNLCPSGRMLLDEELSAPLDLLLSNKSSGINGHVLVVDGGWTIW